MTYIPYWKKNRRCSFQMSEAGVLSKLSATSRILLKIIKCFDQYWLRVINRHRLIVHLKNHNIRPKIDGWKYRYARKLRLSISGRWKNVWSYWIGISYHYISMQLLPLLSSLQLTRWAAATDWLSWHSTALTRTSSLTSARGLLKDVGVSVLHEPNTHEDPCRLVRRAIFLAISRECPLGIHVYTCTVHD